jgi:hypothetical protein
LFTAAVFAGVRSRVRQAELKRVNESVKAASAFFAIETCRHAGAVRFIDRHVARIPAGRRSEGRHSVGGT